MPIMQKGCVVRLIFIVKTTETEISKRPINVENYYCDMTKVILL